MRILFINSVCDYGSTGKIVRNLANGLKEQGHEVLICFGRHRASNQSDAFSFRSDFHTGIHLLMSRFFGRHGLHSSAPTKKLIAQIEAFAPDVIHLHNLHGYYLNVPILFDYLAKKNIKVIWTLHDCWSFSGSSAYFQYNGCKEFDEGCVICNNTDDYPKSVGFKRQRKNFSWKRSAFTSIKDMVIVTPSFWLADLVKTTFFKKYRIEAIYNGIEHHTFFPRNIKDPRKQTIKLLGVSNIWDRRKGLEDFIKLRSQLDDHYEITLIGLNKKQIESLPKNIIGIERTDSIEALAEYYSASDIYLNLSVEETMGLTTVEALACGTPVIVYDQTAVPELVSEQTGLVVKANDMEALKNAILTFPHFEEAACVDHSMNYKIETMLSNYIELILESGI